MKRGIKVVIAIFICSCLFGCPNPPKPHNGKIGDTLNDGEFELTVNSIVLKEYPTYFKSYGYRLDYRVKNISNDERSFFFMDLSLTYDNGDSMPFCLVVTEFGGLCSSASYLPILPSATFSNFPYSLDADLEDVNLTPIEITYQKESRYGVNNNVALTWQIDAQDLAIQMDDFDSTIDGEDIPADDFLPIE